MKVALIADSPTLTTGFGVTTNRIARALTSSGHQVVCFGLKLYGEIFDRAAYPFRIWTVAIDPGAPWGELLRRFLDHETPDVVFVNMDIYNLEEVLGYCARAIWSAPMVVYLVLDGIPAYARYLRRILDFAEILVTTEAGAEYLRRCGAKRLHLAPPGVDRDVFRLLPEVGELRRRAGLEGKFLVGCFGRNCERKQQPRILQAVNILHSAGKARNIYLYFHCKPRAYWHLDEIAEQLGLNDRVLFPNEGDFNETAGVPYLAGPSDSSMSEIPPQTVHIPPSYGYVQRMCCCDLIVNPAHCGDFENVLIESQACGVPLAATDDCGIMAQAMGAGGILLPSADVDRWKVGQRKYHVDVQSIADAIHDVKSDSRRSAELRARGFENAEKYPWSRLEKAAVYAVEEAGRG